MYVRDIASKDSRFILFCWLATLATIATTVAGTVLIYSPIPYYDTWDATLGFIVQIKDRQYDQWWSMYYEHRLILTRLFFWLDYVLFNCDNAFLIGINLLIIGFNVLFFCKLIRATLPQPEHRMTRIMLMLISATYLFFWSQSANITKGFQIQFFLAQTLPLCCFYYLHLATHPEHGKRHFAIAYILGVASIGTMANGMLALPMMTVFAILTRMRRGRVILLAVSSALSIFIFLHELNIPNHHGHPVAWFFQHTYQSYQFVMLFLGNPFYYLAVKSPHGSVPALIAGQFQVVALMYTLWKIRINLRERTFVLALCFFIAYVVCSAVMSAGGRAFKGPAYGLSSRYTTPTIMAWLTLLIIYAPVITSRWQPGKWPLRLACILLLLIPLPLQATALQWKRGYLFLEKTAGLAVTLQVADKTMLNTIYPDYDEQYNYKHLLKIGKDIADHNLSIFSRAPYNDALQTFGKQVAPVADHDFSGQLRDIQPIKEDQRFVRITGWIMDVNTNQIPKAIRLVDENHIVVGYALTGRQIPELVKSIGPQAEYAGFVGYLLADQQGKQITFQTLEPDGQIQIRIPESSTTQPVQNPD